MAFVRTTTFSMTREEAEEMRPGKLVYNALISGRKFISQSMNGLVQTEVWRSINASGRVVFTIMTQWATLDDMRAYAEQPTIRELEAQLSTEAEPISVMVYEAIG